MEKLVNELSREKIGRMGRQQIYRELHYLREVVPEDEKIIEMFVAKVDDMGRGLLLVTDRRVLFYKTGLLPGINVRTVEIPLRDISEVEVSTGFVKGMLAINAGARQFKAEDVFQATHLNSAARYIREHNRPQPDTAAASQKQFAVSAQSMSSVSDQLRELAALKDAGVLTEEEFQTKKTEMLARM